MAEAGLGFRRTGRIVYHKAAKGRSWDLNHSCPINSNTARIAFLSCNRRLNPPLFTLIQTQLAHSTRLPSDSYPMTSHPSSLSVTLEAVRRRTLVPLYFSIRIPSFHCQFSVSFPLQFQSTYSPSWAAVANSKVIPPKMTQRFSRLLPRKCIPFCSGIHGTDSQGHSLTLRLPNLL